jgi:hypothetical protein
MTMRFKKSFKKLVIIMLVSVMIVSSAPALCVQAAEKVWKTITNAHTVIDEIYGFSDVRYIFKV